MSVRDTSLKVVASLAALYVIFGWLGLALAVPPGYATIVWPASGIAVAGLLFSGPAQWPAIFIGSFMVNFSAGAAATGTIFEMPTFVSAICIAVGSTLQSVAAFTLIKKAYRIPIALRGLHDIVGMIVVGAVLPCLLSATIGVAALVLAGIMPHDSLIENWAIWYTGDMVGILAVVPVALLNPWRPWDPLWKQTPITRFTLAAYIVLALPIIATFYAWKITSVITYQRNAESFHVLAEDNIQALKHRIESYKQSLNAGVGLLQTTSTVTLDQWRRFVETIEIDKNLRGISGIGVIRAVKRSNLPFFLANAEVNGVAGIRVHPETTGDELFIIEYIEPLKLNAQAVGLDIAFEANRLDAAVASRDSGQATITGRILLVQDHTQSPGFLLLRPFYDRSKSLETVEERRAAFRGWVYAPFVGLHFLDGLTSSQGTKLRLRVYDGATENPETAIFDSNPDLRSDHAPHFTMTRRIDVMHRHWTLVWESLPPFEESLGTSEPKLVLLGGAIGTILLAVLLYSLARREDDVQKLVHLKTRELAARASENRAIVDNAAIGFIVLDDSLTIVAANGATRGMLGFSSEDMVGWPVSAFLNFDLEGDSAQSRGFDDHFPTSGETSDSCPAIVSATTKDGAVILLDMQRSQWRAEAGDLRWTLILRDVTEEWRISSALETSEKRWSHALQGANLGVFDINLVTGRSFVSETWKTMLGFSPDARIEPQTEWLTRVHPDDLPYVQAADIECLDGRRDRSIAEYRLQRADDQWIWLRSDATVIERDASGKATRLIGVQMDVTQLRDAEAALQASRKRFESAIENAPVGMALLNLKGDWMQLNGSLCELMGLREEEIKASPIEDIFHPDDSGEIQALFDRLRNSPGSRVMSEHRLITSDDRIIWCLVGASLVRDDVKDHVGNYIILQFQDITHRKEVERLKTEFVSMVSHELRTPLTSIRGSLGLVVGTQANKLPETVVNLLRIAHNNCERLISLINDILDMEKIASRGMAFDFENYDLGLAVESAIEATQAIFDKGQITVETIKPDAATPIYVDADRLHQVLVNLLSNAAKFSPKGGVITVTITQNGESTHVSVADQGPGIPDTFKDKIFSRFSQADSSSTRAKGGTGLGLHISKMIVERMDGEIGFYNAATGGAVFTVTLPLAATRDEKTIVAPAERQIASGAELPKGLHIEADSDFAEIVQTMLHGRLVLDHVATIKEFRAAVAREAYDFYVSDGLLPDGSIDDVLAEISQSATARPVVALTTKEVDSDATILIDVIIKSRASEKEIVAAIIEASNAALRAA
ncbi:CHASE domain-containing protein [Jiella sp. MQZ9-1]|uniref:histidine kinase n=1 Tax=Jiella flava TaxID=2816857 RepID=A0A939FZC8_9HYPH|nr:CHASE domain-containing protein [Jiella flava]MBO0662144.1 CHASE domain-containing protein [Jiella flava]MCD2470527.1 CHASE domain-containing protein [Jiella flava]